MILRMVLLTLLFLSEGCARSRSLRATASPPAPPAPPAEHICRPVENGRVEFAVQIRPLLERRCSPCHFPGGSMYERLPFDREATIHHLGTKMFGRITAEDEQALLRRFLDPAEAVALPSSPPPITSPPSTPPGSPPA